MNKRMKKSLWALVGTMLCGCLLLAPGARAAETTALEDALEQTARLQQLAEEYAAGQQTETEHQLHPRSALCRHHLGYDSGGAQ